MHWVIINFLMFAINFKAKMWLERTRGSFHNETPRQKDKENTQDGNKGRRKTHKSGMKEGTSMIMKINIDSNHVHCSSIS